MTTTTMAQRTELASAPSIQFPEREVRLVHISDGMEIAGAGTRPTNGDLWSVEFEFDGSRHSRRFRDPEAATDLFLRWTVDYIKD